jgi:cold shock CspA family protein
MKSRDYGTIDHWNGTSFGFIKPDSCDSKDLFFHTSEISADPNDIRRGD